MTANACIGAAALWHLGRCVMRTARAEIWQPRGDILGIVGAGGIGFYIQTYVRSFQYDKAASVTMAVVAMVIAIEAINVALRRRFT